MTARKTYCYLITWSGVDTVPVGSYIIDHEGTDSTRRDRGDRVWSLYREATAEFTDGWAGRRLDRLCTRCRDDHRKAALHGHDGKCGAAPVYVPKVPAGVTP